MSVRPKTGLAAGTYTDTLTITGDNGISLTAGLSFTVNAASTAPTYTITASAGSGGSISPSGAVYVTEGNSQIFAITPDSEYRINTVAVDGINQGAVTTYTFTNVTASHTINATFTRTGGGGGGSEGGGRSTTPTYKAVMKEGNRTKTNLPVTVNKDTESASIDVDSQSFTQGGTVITIPSIPGIDTYSVGIPVPALSTSEVRGTLTLDTDVGSVTVPSNMLTGVPGISGSKVENSIGHGDKSDLPEDVKDAIGDKPLIRLRLSIDGKQTDWNNPNAPVTVSIPYTPTAAELANPESIVVWYIDGSGNVVTIPNGRYDPATGTVTFTTTHFSHYAVAYSPVSFGDVAAGAWYKRAVSFIAARGIAAGTGSGNFSPEAKLTRGQFIVMLMKAYGIAPDTNPKDNFSDAGNTWYTGYLAAAKRLGISPGIGNNLFAPEKEITRQEMFTLLYNALKVIKQLPEGSSSGKTLADFSDADAIAPWAKEAMMLLVKSGIVGGSNGKLTPQGTTARAEMAQVLYNLLGK